MKTVLMALPRLGQPEFEQCQAAMCFASADRFGVTMDPQPSSLLAFGFNKAWCNFANGPFDYFAMLHADIFPHGPWLDTMIDELENGGYGVLHAAVAIKDTRGLTSTAIGSVDDLFGLVRRITVTELQKLPETFGYPEAIKVLEMPEKPRHGILPNTGVMLVKRDGFPFDSFRGFGIIDQISKGADGKWKADVEPEDWAFGRWCGRNGVKVGCTRRVTTSHMGRASFPNNEAWGQWATDLHHEAALKLI